MLKRSLLLALFALANMTILCAQTEGTASATNVDYTHIGFTGDIEISFDLIDCNETDFYYVMVYHEDAEIGHKTYPSNSAIEGANTDSPMTCGASKSIVWSFSKENLKKRGIGEGDFVIEVYTISSEENKRLWKLTDRYNKKRAKLDDKILRAELKGKRKRVARLQRRLAKKQARYTKKAERLRGK